MANKAKGFTIVAGKRESGAPYWLARGTRDRRQIRREFDNRADALAFAEKQNSEINGTIPKQSHLLTHLSPEQLHAAEAVVLQLQRDFPGAGILDLIDYYRALAGSVPPSEASKAGAALQRLKERFPQTTVAFACDWFASNYQPPKNSITLTIALEHYLADAARRHSKHSLSTPQFNRVGYAMAEFERYYTGEEAISSFTTTQLHDYLKETTKGKDGGAFSNKTWVNRRGYLTAFFEFCRQERWIETNPASGIRTYKKRALAKPAPALLTVAEAKSIMEYLETFQGGRLVPFWSLCLFAGIRPDWDNGEISKIEPAHFDLANSELKLPADITKTHRARLVRLQPNLVKWLKRYPLDRYPIICANFKKLHLKTRKHFALGHDVLRHTYCSMLVGKFRSVADAALQAGNSEGVLWSSYMNLVAQKDAEAFWGISPKVR